MIASVAPVSMIPQPGSMYQESSVKSVPTDPGRIMAGFGPVLPMPCTAPTGCDEEAAGTVAGNGSFSMDDSSSDDESL